MNDFLSLLIQLQIIDRTNAVNELEKQLKQTENSLSKYKSMLSLEEAKNEKEKLITSVKSLKSKLEASLDSNDVISVDERRRIETTYENITKTYRKRKRICNEILDTILENYPKKKSNLIDEIGVEPDDTSVPSV